MEFDDLFFFFFFFKYFGKQDVDVAHVNFNQYVGPETIQHTHYELSGCQTRINGWAIPTIELVVGTL